MASGQVRQARCDASAARCGASAPLPPTTPSSRIVPITELKSAAVRTLAMGFASIMDYVQALFSFFIAPLFGTVLLGMMWRRTTPQGGFWGLLAGTLTSIGLWAWVRVDHSALARVALSSHAQDMAENMFRALWSWLVCVAVTIVVSLVTRPKPDNELEGLVYGLTPVSAEAGTSFYQRPAFWAAVVGVVFVGLNLVFW